MPETLAEKVWDRHVVRRARRRRARPALHRPPPRPRGDLPAGLRRAAARAAGACGGPTSRSRPWTTTCPPTSSTARSPIRSPRRQIEVLDGNCAEFGITCYPMGDANQGIVHVIGPEQGLTQPGMTIVCGDSHTSTHGAFGALAFGIGTSEVEHVLATQTLPQRRPRTMAVTVDGDTARRRDGEGRRARHHRPARHRRRGRPRHRVPGLGDRGAVDGGPHDGLQHVDRGRRPGGDGRPRRDHVRLPRGAAPRAEGSPPGTRARRLARAGHRRRRPVRRRGRSSTRRRSSPTSRGAPTPPRSCAIDGAVPEPGRPVDSRRAGGGGPRARLHGPRGRHPDPRRSRSTRSSSARARTRGSRTCVPRPACSTAAGSGRASARSSCRVPGESRQQAEAEGLDGVFIAAGFEWREPRLLDVPRHEPRQARAGRALRVDVEPQLRGTPGPRRPHPSRLAGRRRRDRGRRPLRHPGGPRGLSVEPVRVVSAAGGPARPLRRRHRPDHPERVAEAGRADRLRRRAVRRVARRPRLRPQPRRLRRGDDPRRRPELRHRLVTRARRLGAGRLRLRGRHQPSVRRHLPQQLHPLGPRAGRGRPTTRAGSSWTPSSRTRRSRSWSTSTADSSRRRRWGSRCRSGWTTSPATGCFGVSTTSASPPSTPRTSTPTRRAGSAWLPIVAAN